MSNALEMSGLTLVEPQASPAPKQQPAPATGPVGGRRWSDGAGGFVPTDPNAPWTMSQQWPNLVAALSEQAVDGSNLMLRALNYLVGAGRLRHGEAKALSEAMHQLRATSLRAQQITRLAGGRIRQARERVDLSELVGHVLGDRAAEIEAAGVAVSSDLEAVEVLLDPPVAISLVNAVLDWATGFSKQIHLMLSPADFPGPARLQVRVATPAPAQPSPADGTGTTGRPRARRLNDGLHWMLLRQIAASSSLEVRRTRADGAALLTIDFPKTFLCTEGLSCLELTGQGEGEGSGAPVRESWVQVIAADPKLRAEAVASLRKMGMDAQGAPDVAQARAAMRETGPNVLVAAYDVPPDAIARFRQEALGGEERCPLVEITREAPSFHLSGFDRFETPKVGRDQLAAELPPTVLFELVKVG